MQDEGSAASEENTNEEEEEEGRPKRWWRQLPFEQRQTAPTEIEVAMRQPEGPKASRVAESPRPQTRPQPLVPRQRQQIPAGRYLSFEDVLPTATPAQLSLQQRTTYRSVIVQQTLDSLYRKLEEARTQLEVRL
jgi:hypothetical protein